MPNPNASLASVKSQLQGFGPIAGWEARANCIDADQDLFFGTNRDTDERSKHSSRRTKAQATAALALCASCPVLIECRTWSIEVGLPYGIAGGLTEEERTRERKRRGLHEGPGRKPITARQPQHHTIASGAKDGSLRALPIQLRL